MAEPKPTTRTVNAKRETKARPATLEDFMQSDAEQQVAAAAFVAAVEPPKPAADPHEQRLTRLEEWRALHDVRVEKVETRVTDLADGASYLRANMLTKEAYADQQRDQGRHMWVVASVIVAAIALLFAVYAWWSSKHESKPPPPVAAAATAPQPIVIQVPAYPTLPAKK